MSRNGDNMCGLMGRMTVLVLASAGIALSIVSALDCRFLYFENDNADPNFDLPPPFDQARRADVGVFSYRIRESVDPPTYESSSCVKYDEKFAGNPYEVVVAAQVCALLAPIFAGLALIVNIVETCFLSFFCSFLISCGLFLVASGIQAGTFSLYAEPDFCYDSDSQSCDVGLAVYLSAVASVLFFVCCVLLCCFPHPDPVCGREKPHTTTQSAGNNQPRVFVQPVIIEQQQPPQDPGYHESEAPPRPRKKKTKKKKKRQNQTEDVYANNMITEDEFDEIDAPVITDGSRVEMKEKVFPDGTRQVDEITHHPDGSTTIMSKTYQD